MRAIAISVLIFSCGMFAAAQSALSGAAVAGRVLDSAGGAVAGAAVALRRGDTGLVRRAVSDAGGTFQLFSLPVGVYDLEVERNGFAPYRRTGLVLELGTRLQLTIILQPAAVHASVTVAAKPPGLDVSQSSLSSRVDRERIEELPVHSRNALDFVLMQPGVSAAAPRSGSPHVALADSGFSVGGLRPRSNNICIDGLDNNDEFSGASRTELSPEIVQEYQVVNNGLSAQYGGASGGAIDVVTRSGGNTVHGDAFVFAQGAALNARDPFSGAAAKPPFDRLRVGLARGGAIEKNRVFYYAAAEQERNRGRAAVDLDPAAVAAIDSFLGGGADPGLPQRRLSAAPIPIARAETEASGRIDAQLSARRSLMLRYALTNNRVAGNAYGEGGLNDAGAFGNSFIADQDLAAGLTTTHGSRAVEDWRFQVATRRVRLASNQTAGPGVEIAGIADFGRPYGGNSFRRENHYQVNYSYMRGSGPNLWTLGGTLNRVRERVSIQDGFGGLYQFASLPDFFAGAPDSFRQSFGSPGSDYAVTSYGAFVQDHWQAARRLSLDLGLRYDLEHLPAGFADDRDDFSPRLGLAFNPAAGWLLRAGFGVFYDRAILANLNRGIEFGGSQGFQQVAEGAQAGAILQATQGGTLSAPWPGLGPSIYRPDPNLATPYSMRASAGVERYIGGDTTISLDYLLSRGVKLPRTRNINLQSVGPILGPGRLAPGLDAIYQLEDSSSSTYNGVTATFNRRMANDFEWLASYTWAKTLDDASSFEEQPQDPFALAAELGYSLQDQRQRLTFDALWDLPIGPDEDEPGQQAHGWFERAFDHIELAPILIVASGVPADPLLGFDANHSLAFPLAARPAGFGRNSLRLPPTANLNLRVLKYFPHGEFAHLDVVAEAFNVLNHPNAAALNPFFGPDPSPLPSFGHAIASQGARVIEFSLDYEY